MKHVVSISGGVTSWAAGRVVKDRLMKPGDDIVLLFTDTLIEDADVYEFLRAGAQNIGVPVTTLCDGRTPWQVFLDEKFLGNSRVDPCSKILKRKKMDKWRNENCTPETSIHYLGLDFTEINRYERHRDRMLAKGGWIVKAPLIDARITKPDAIEWAIREGLRLPAAYAQGFSHANCGRKCVKAGMGHWARLLRLDPSAYDEVEQYESKIRKELNRDVSILKDRSGGGPRRPLTLADFRVRIESNASLPFDMDEEGGCGCALDLGEDDD